MSLNTLNSPYSIRHCLYFDDFNTFHVLGQKFVKFFGFFLENLKNQKDILKLTDLYLTYDKHGAEWKFSQIHSLFFAFSSAKS